MDRTNSWNPTLRGAAAPNSNVRQHGERMECAICLNDIPVHEEAFLLPSCYHAFHFTCITTWTQQQLRHPPMRQGSDGSYQPCGSTQCLCPLCKRPYTTIVYECIDGTFK